MIAEVLRPRRTFSREFEIVVQNQKAQDRLDLGACKPPFRAGVSAVAKVHVFERRGGEL